MAARKNLSEQLKEKTLQCEQQNSMLVTVADALDEAIENGDLSCYESKDLQARLNKFLGRRAKVTESVCLKIFLEDPFTLSEGSEWDDTYSYHVIVKDNDNNLIYDGTPYEVSEW